MTFDSAAAVRAVAAGVLVAALGAAATGCATTPPGPAGTRFGVVAAESCWGSLASQLAGDRAVVTSVIDTPGADPHDYEPTAADARAVAGARVVIVNGLGYDTWATKLAETNPADGRVLLDVGNAVGLRSGANPHRWYAPQDVRTVVDRITAAYQRIDPAGAGYFDARRAELLGTRLGGYFELIATVRAGFAGTPVGASESMFEPMAEATGLDLITPRALLAAVSAGSDPSGVDKATADAQIRDRRLRMYVYNSQNATPDVRAQVAAARTAGIPVVTITETPVPAGASFQDWQVTQLVAIRDALAATTTTGGR